MAKALSVLVVDDEEDIRELVSEILEMAGHRVVTAPSGPRALELHSSERFQVLLCDLTMQGMSGWEVVRAVRQRDAAIGIALLSGWEATLPAERLEAAGIDAVLGKPFQVDRMLQVVESLGRRDPGTAAD